MAGAMPEERVDRPVVRQGWTALTFLHWSYEADVVQRLLPPELEVETWEGRAWVGLTPFLMTDVRFPFAPPLPGLSSFPETNLRTYVRPRAGGAEGIWFLSIDVDRLALAVGARLLGVAYHWSEMQAERATDVSYRSRRNPPSPHAGVGHDIVVEPGAPFADGELGDFDHWLTGRWRAYTRVAGQLLVVPVQHQPWPLWRARVTRLDEGLTAAAGLPAPGDEPLVHYSPGVDVRLGAPRLAG